MPDRGGLHLRPRPDYYPGDDQVDWTCVDVYAGSELTPLADLLEPFLHWAAAHPHPIMIGEYGVSRAWTAGQRASWLRDATTVFRRNTQIKAVLYFESNPDNRTPPANSPSAPTPTPSKPSAPPPTTPTSAADPPPPGPPRFLPR
ncbi:hypothetical protein ACFQZ4_20735 [Catellatospora coxensis]